MSGSAAETTKIRTQNVITLLDLALNAAQPLRRAQYLAEAQRQAGWALRSAVDECRELAIPWRVVAPALELAHDVLYRQHKAGGPVVSGSAYYQSGTRNDRRGFRLVPAFRTVDDGILHVLPEDAVMGLETFESLFAPGGPSPYRNRHLRYYYRWVEGISIADLGRSAGYTIQQPDQGIIACVTEPVFDELFGPPVAGRRERLDWEARTR